jgi:hypothetical protein
MEGGGATSYGLMGPRPPVHAPLLNINVEEPRVAIMVEKEKVIFLLDSGPHFSVLPFSPSPQSNDKIIIWGISGKLLEHYFTQPLLLGRPPLLSFFPHSA